MSEHMDTDQFRQIIAAIKSVKDELNSRMDHLNSRMDHLEGRIDHLDGRIDRMDRRINIMSGIYLAGLVFILTGVGIYTNVVLMIQNLD